MSSDSVTAGASRAGCRRWRWLAALSLVAHLAVGAAWAEEESRAADRQQLLALMREVEAGINAQDAKRLTAMMTDDVTVIWLNAEVSRGKDEVLAYYARMVGGEGTILEKYLTRVTLDAPARFFGEAAIAEGRAADEFYPHARSPFRLDSHWSSTLRKVDGEWRIASLHLSANVFTNPLMAEARQWIWYAGAGGFVGGAIVIFVLLRLRRR